MYDEELDENTVYLVDIDWKPAPESLELDDENFAEKIAEKVSGVTLKGFTKEVKLWQDSLNSLPQYDEIEIRKEIATWNISIPKKDDFDWENYSLFYALQVNYRNRLTEILNVVYAHNEMLMQAHKNLKEISANLAKGTAVDKSAIASYTVHPFQVASSHTKRLLTYLEHVLKNIDFAAQQMERMMRDKQTLSRINSNFLQDGMSYMSSKEKMPSVNNRVDSAVIRTRNKFTT